MEHTGPKVRWGIVSTGRITHQFVQDFAFVPNGEVVAVASRSQEAADAFAARYGIPRAHAGYDRLLDDPQVDAVYIATPHALHFSNTADAIQARKHVLCEKPFTVSAREARNLFRIAEQSSVFVMEAMWTWFLPAVRKALEWVQQGRIDPVRAGIFLIALRMKRETPEENRGVLQAILDAREVVTADVDEVVDIADPYDGYNRTIPASPFLAPLLAECGIPAFSP